MGQMGFEPSPVPTPAVCWDKSCLRQRAMGQLLDCPVPSPKHHVSHLLNTHLKTCVSDPYGTWVPKGYPAPRRAWDPNAEVRSLWAMGVQLPSVLSDRGALCNTLLCTAHFRLPFRLWIRLGFGLLLFFGLLFGILFCLRFSGRGFAPLTVCTWLWPTK